MRECKTLRLTTCALFISLGILLPSVFHALNLGSVFSPMHLPVLLCGFLLGPIYGGVCGAVVPYLSSFITGMPPAFPVALSMTFELATYGILSGLFYRLLGAKCPQPTVKVIAALVLAMLGGRIVLGVVNAILFAIQGSAYSFEIFLSSAFLKAWPGILLQLVLVPLTVEVLRSAKILQLYQTPVAAPKEDEPTPVE